MRGRGYNRQSWDGDKLRCIHGVISSLPTNRSSNSGVMRCVFVRIAASAARDNKVVMSPVTPPACIHDPAHHRWVVADSGGFAQRQLPLETGQESAHLLPSRRLVRLAVSGTTQTTNPGLR